MDYSRVLKLTTIVLSALRCKCVKPVHSTMLNPCIFFWLEHFVGYIYAKILCRILLQLFMHLYSKKRTYKARASIVGKSTRGHPSI